MYPYQPIDKPVVAPTKSGGRVCFSFDAKWLPILFGLLQTLQQPQTWQGNPSLGIGESSLLIQDFMFAAACPKPENGGIEMEDCMGCCIRVQDGMLQVLACGEWTTIPGGDLTQLISANKGQPKPSGDVPPNSPQTFCVDIPASGFTPSPFAVQPGYKIELVDATGQWSDGADTTFGIFDWYCASGSPTLTGDCIGVPHTEGGDPMPDSAHMALIAKIDPDILIDFNAGPFIVPDSATGTVLQFQANDSAISDNEGVVSACFKITNLQPVTWTHHFDLRGGLQGWMIRTSGGTAPFPVYTPGVGIEASNPSALPGQGLFELGIALPFPMANIQVRYLATVDSSDAGSHGVYNIGSTFAWNTQIESFNTSQYPAIDFTAAFTLDTKAFKVNASVANAGDSCTITDIWVSGIGTDPF